MSAETASNPASDPAKSARRRGPGRPFQKGEDPRRAEPTYARARLEAERLAIVEELLGDLGRVPTAIERLLLEELASLTVRARTLRAKGQPTEDIARLMTRIAGKLGAGARKPARRHRPWHEIRADAERRRAVTVSHDADHVAPRREHLEQQQHLAGDPLEELARAGQHQDAADLEREHSARAELDAGSRP